MKIDLTAMYPMRIHSPKVMKGYEYREVDLMIEDNSTMGEKVWCLLSPNNIIRYDSNECNEINLAILCNNSIYYDKLFAGQVVPIKFNMNYRPSVVLEWLHRFFELRSDL